MSSILFFNFQQMKILRDSGVSLSEISQDILGKYLSSEDCYTVLNMTALLQQPGNLLSQLGYEKTQIDNCIYDSKYVLPTLNSLVSNGNVLNAYMNDTKSIIIWEEPSEAPYKNTNDMLKQSLLNIANSIVNILGFTNFKKTKQFELLYFIY